MYLDSPTGRQEAWDRGRYLVFLKVAFPRNPFFTSPSRVTVWSWSPGFWNSSTVRGLAVHAGLCNKVTSGCPTVHRGQDSKMPQQLPCAEEPLGRTGPQQSQSSGNNPLEVMNTGFCRPPGHLFPLQQITNWHQSSTRPKSHLMFHFLIFI